jgi:hypothetical protein
VAFDNQMASYNAQNQQSQAWGKALGAIGGIGLNYATGGTMAGATNLFGFEEGGLVPDDEGIRRQGIPITPSMSPSGGAAIDDVEARLNEGEFIVPADVLQWKGEEFFQKTIAKAREDKGQAPAKPSVMAVPVERPRAAAPLPV